jgi:hypothetical protein
MMKIQVLLATALCGAMFTVVANASAQGNQSGYATVVRVQGDASYSLGDDNWHPLVAGKYLPPGAVIRTGFNGVADVVLGKNIDLPQSAWTPDKIAFASDAPVRGMVGYKPSTEQNVVRLTPETTLGIDKLTVTDTGADTISDTELNLKKGKIFASVKKLSGASQYLIKLPSGVAGVRGTKFSLGADGAASCYESTGGGLVESLVNADGTTATTLVLPGQMFSPGNGQPPVTIPQDLFSVLAQFFTSLQTIYLQVHFCSFDSTRCYISNIHGGDFGNHTPIQPF